MWSGLMPEYRVYILGSDNHFERSVALECADDGEAVQKAKQLVERHGVELWQRDRKIATFPAGWSDGVSAREDERPAGA